MKLFTLSMRPFIGLLLAVGLLVSLKPVPRRQPNILLILADDMGWGDLSSHQNPVIETPVLDKLASQGAQFDRFFVSPLCAPTRASILTGRYHLRTGVSSVTSGLETMRSSEVTLAEVFGQAGYRTGIFGKWHNGAHYPEDPIGQGFEEFLGFCGGHWTNYFDTHLQHNQQMVPTKGYITDVLTDAAMNFISQHRTEPFFCYVPYNAPHGPFQVPDAFFQKYKAKGVNDLDAAIYGMVDNMDANIGRLLHRLDELNLSDNTIVLFLTDNGPNSDRYNGAMKGKKGAVDEGGVRVPLLIRWPGHIAPQTVVKPIAAHIDLLPTLVELAGLPTPKTLPLDGKSLVPLLARKADNWPERTLFTHVLRTDTSHRIRPFMGAARTSRFRFVRAESANELYDLLADPAQQNNLATLMPDIMRQLGTDYGHWFEDVTRLGIHPEVTQVGYRQAPRTDLFAPDAAPTGGLRYFGKKGFAHDWFTGFQSPTQTAAWTIDVTTTGTYRISFLYNCPSGFVGNRMQVEVAGQTIEKTVSSEFTGKVYPSPDRVPRIEAYEKDWATLDIGQLALPKGKHKLVVHGLDQASVPFELKAVRIHKINDL